MAASDHLQPQQLALFMRADELAAGSRIEIGEHLGPKLDNARYSGMADDVARHGVRVPVNVMHWGGDRRPQLADGHHRVASALAAAPRSFVPLVHHTDDDEMAEYRTKAEWDSPYWPHHEDD